MTTCYRYPTTRSPAPPTTSRYRRGSWRHKVYRRLELRYWQCDDPADYYMAPWEIARKVEGGSLFGKDITRWTLHWLVHNDPNIRRREHYRANGERVSWMRHEGYKYAYHPEV